MVCRYQNAPNAVRTRPIIPTSVGRRMVSASETHQRLAAVSVGRMSFRENFTAGAGRTREGKGGAGRVQLNEIYRTKDSLWNSIIVPGGGSWNFILH